MDVAVVSTVLTSNTNNEKQDSTTNLELKSMHQPHSSNGPDSSSIEHPIMDPAASFDLPKHDASLVSDKIRELQTEGYLESSSDLKMKPPPYPAAAVGYFGSSGKAEAVVESSVGEQEGLASNNNTSPATPLTPTKHQQQQQYYTSPALQTPPRHYEQRDNFEQQKQMRRQQAEVAGSFEVQRRDAAAAVAAAREQDVAAAFASLPRVKPHWRHNYMKLLLVGENGLGRTTFVRNLFAAYAEHPNFPVADASGANARRVFSENPESLCTELVVHDPDQMVVWHYLVQDTPGYGDLETVEDVESDRAAVLDHIQYCSQRFFDQEVDPSRRHAMPAVMDTRVDVCLFFLPPHRLRKMDIRFIKQLSQLVPVVPILAKADTMTPEELKDFRIAVRKCLVPSTDSSSSSSFWKFSQEALEAAGASSQGPPFAVIGSNTVDAAVGRFWPVRKYPWGRCESLLTAHSELPALRRLLFETGYWDLKAHTEESYLEFRKRECDSRGSVVPKQFHGLVKLVVGTAAVVAASLLIVNAPPYLRSEVVRKETIRRVKNKVGEAVDSALDTVQDVQERATGVGKVAQSTAMALGHGTKQAVKEVGKVLEGESAARRVREEEERRAARSWWKFWGR